MLQKLKTLLRQAAVADVAKADLEQAERDLYAAQSNAEMWNHEVVLQTGRINRLRGILNPPAQMAKIPATARAMSTV